MTTTPATPATPAPGGPAELAERWELHRLGGRPGLSAYLAELWRRRHFALELARSRFRAENEADRLGAAWIVLRPLINAAVYGTVFGFVLVSRSRPADYLPFLVSGVFVFQYFSSSFNEGARSIVANVGLVTTLHFPRAVLPFAVVYQNLLSQVWMIGTLCIIVVANGDPIRVSWLQVVPAMALMTLFNLGVAFVAARMTIHLRDVAQLIPFVTRMFFYLSGIFVSMPALLHDKPDWTLAIAQANPVYIYLTLVRVGFLGPDTTFAVPHDPSQHYPYDLGQLWLSAAAWGIGFMVLGFLFFWRAEDEYGRE